jgi:hypothetical protein
MTGDGRTVVNRAASLEICAAELALAAYRVALRTRTQGNWLDLELELWRALTDTLNGRSGISTGVYKGAAATVPVALMECCPMSVEPLRDSVSEINANGDPS